MLKLHLLDKAPVLTQQINALLKIVTIEDLKSPRDLIFNICFRDM